MTFQGVCMTSFWTTTDNILAAISAGIALDIDLLTIKHGIESVSRVQGRHEPVPISQDNTVIVDYCHTPDALEKALHVLAEMTDNKSVTHSLTGCPVRRANGGSAPAVAPCWPG